MDSAYAFLQSSLGFPAEGIGHVERAARARKWPLKIKALLLVLIFVVTTALVSLWYSQSPIESDDFASSLKPGPWDTRYAQALESISEMLYDLTSSTSLRGLLQVGVSIPNDVMTMANMIYLGVITERVPILPPFTPSHVLQDGEAWVLPFGEVFDVPRMQKAMNIPILEWHDVKREEDGERDELGCWNIWEVSQHREHFPRYSSVLDYLNLDISYTLAPNWVKLWANVDSDPHATFWSLARLGYAETRDVNLRPPRLSPYNVSLPPDEQLLCYDYLYYVCAQQPYEYTWEYSPAWRFVAQHMHFTRRLERLADFYINRAIGIPDLERTPAYIVIHARHKDFGDVCGDIPLEDCFAPLSAIARRVQEVKDELFQKKGLVINHVLMTSDENDPAWWQEVAELGWVTPDHSHTRQVYGTWYPVLIDAAIQSGAAGFVGTARSTMSVMAARRVAAWQDGAIRYVEWGRPGADDH